MMDEFAFVVLDQIFPLNKISIEGDAGLEKKNQPCFCESTKNI
jgi:hypothetical protein